MTFDRDKTFSGGCCTDCTMLLANGETPAEMSEAETAEYLARVAHHCAGCEITLGMFTEDHACAANFTVTYAPSRYSRRRLTVEVLASDYEDATWQARYTYGVPARAHVFARWPRLPRRHELMTVQDMGGECECEQLTFSWSACDVCGSSLGGSRNAVVFWIQPDPEPAGISG